MFACLNKIFKLTKNFSFAYNRGMKTAKNFEQQRKSMFATQNDIVRFQRITDAREFVFVQKHDLAQAGFPNRKSLQGRGEVSIGFSVNEQYIFHL
ncbi:hypothetical protein D3C87_1314380 [compost metagenome]